MLESRTTWRPSPFMSSTSRHTSAQQDGGYISATIERPKNLILFFGKMLRNVLILNSLSKIFEIK